METGKYEPWLKLPEEASKAFNAFNAYREMGKDRSVRKVAQKLNISNTAVQKMSVRWGWPERAAAWDNHLVQTATRKVENAVEEMVTRHLNIALFLQTKGVNSISESRGPLHPSIAKDFIKLGVDMERLLRGEPTELRGSKAEVSISDPYDELSTDELRALAALCNEQTS